MDPMRIGFIIAGLIVVYVVYTRYTATTPSPSSVSTSPSGVVGCPEKSIMTKRYNAVNPPVSYNAWLNTELPPGMIGTLSPSCPEGTIMRKLFDITQNLPPGVQPSPGVSLPNTYSEFLEMSKYYI